MTTTRTVRLFEVIYTEAGFRSGVRASLYGLWTGNFSHSEFIDDFTEVVFTGYTSAWYAGAKRAGVAQDELTEGEIVAMTLKVYEQISFIAGLASWLLEHNRESGTKWSTVWNLRGELWVGRWNQFENLGFSYAEQDEKQRWDLGATSEHCSSCSKLAGKVKRKSQWIAAGIYPQSHDLKCKGYKCKCKFTGTTEPISKGKLPRIP